MLKKIIPIISFLLFISSSYSTPFISQWNTSITTGSISLSNQTNLPLVSDGTYNFFVDWGDGSNDTITVWNEPAVTHSYSSEGVYTISINGTINGFRFNNGGDKTKIINVEQWGDLKLTTGNGVFYGASNLQSNATDTLNTTGVTTFRNMFRDASSFDGNLSGIDTSLVNDANRMFNNAINFNSDIGNWNTSNFADIREMFLAASSFNSDLLGWDTSNVYSLYNTFSSASSFTGDISNWNTSGVSDLFAAFAASGFNNNINSWDVSNVNRFDWMFSSATSFNQPLNNWIIETPSDMNGIFNGASSFDQSLTNWNVSNVSAMGSIFDNSGLSNQTYSDILNAWSSLPTLQNGVNLGAVGIGYYNTSNVSRQNLITTYSWTITDAGSAGAPPTIISTPTSVSALPSIGIISIITSIIIIFNFLI